jgi:hypothetical protein
MKKAFAILCFLVFAYTANSQVLISLLLGDKLNSDKLEFGLDGGINWLNMTNSPGTKKLFDWNIGFYFDFKMKHNLFIHTGVIVKSKMGTAGITPYSLNNQDLDSLFIGGSVDRKINYFNVPALLRYRFVDYLYAEAGIQLGLRYTAYDFFTKEIYHEKDLKFTQETKDNYTRLDAGGVAGMGYKLKHGQGMTIYARYYYGFVDVDKITSGTQNNTSWYLGICIPIGKGKAEKKAEEKKAGGK